jgi:hypothetical protein
MSERIVDGTLFNTNSIMYCAPKASPQGAKSVNILSKSTKTGLTLSTPLMLTWGASDYKAEGEEKGNGKFEMSLQFPSSEYSNEDTNAFFKNIKALEDKIKSDALVYSKEWFGKVHKSSEVVDALWSPMLKYSKDKQTGEYDYSKAPTLKVKIPQWEGVWKSEIYDEDGGKLYPTSENPNCTPLDYLKKGSNIACIIQFGGIWFVNGKFSANWKLVQAVVQKPRATLQGQCFIKLKSQDKEKLKTQTVVDEDTDNISSVIVEDSDEEFEEQKEVVIEQPIIQEKEEEEVIAAAEPVVVEETKIVKKKIIKKKVES